MRDGKRKAAASAADTRVKKRARKSGGRSSAQALPANASFWQKLCPELHVDDASFVSTCKPIELDDTQIERMRAQLISEGFFTLPPEALPWVCSLAAMRKGVRRLTKRGWPASLLLVYDEAWAMAHQISVIMRRVSGGCANSLDMLAWSVTPSFGEAGFAPHRDRQPPDVPASFRADGTARYCTCWVALSHATPDNSCMHMVPRPYDPGYDAGDDHSANAEDPLLAIFRSSDEAVQAVRACPLRPGGAVIFTHRTMHWGSKGAADCERARVSISFGHSDPAFEQPYFAKPRSVLPFPPLKLRVALASSQLICYHERFRFGVALLRRLGASFQARKAAFATAYAEKVAAEFKAALDDRCRGGVDGHRGGASGAAAATRGAAEADDEEEDADAALDDALDAMLDAQASAEGNLYDDFDADDYVREEDSD